jgi:hypothetical protein
MTALRKFLTLPRSGRALLIEAWLALQLVQVGVGLFRFRSLRGLLAAVIPILRRREPATLSPQQLAWAVETASKRTLGPTTCLVQALAAQLILAVHGHRAELHLGVARGEGGGVRAHAWVECNGEVVVGGMVRDSERYVPLAAFDTGVS